MPIITALVKRSTRSQGDQKLSYSKQCKYCDKKINMIQTNGKYLAFDDADGITLHKFCRTEKTRSILQRIEDLESLIYSLLHRIESHSERLEKLEGIV